MERIKRALEQEELGSPPVILMFLGHLEKIKLIKQIIGADLLAI